MAVKMAKGILLPIGLDMLAAGSAGIPAASRADFSSRQSFCDSAIKDVPK